MTLDVTDEVSIKGASREVAEIVGDMGLDYILNNAGVVRVNSHRILRKGADTEQNPSNDDGFNLKVADLMFCIQSNVAGPALVCQNFLPLLEKGKRKVIMNMTSGLASIGLDLGPKCTSYSISKAALNMLVSGPSHLLQ